MILEVAILKIKPNQSRSFEQAFSEAQSIITNSPGYISHELLRCHEVKDKYILLVRWNSINDHEIGFRKSALYQEWKQLLHHYYDPFPTVEHFEPIP